MLLTSAQTTEVYRNWYAATGADSAKGVSRRLELNNLAWVLAHRENPELDRAHALAQRATHLVSRPDFYYTLATILAELYRKLGHSELAELYDDRAQSAQENQ